MIVSQIFAAVLLGQVSPSTISTPASVAPVKLYRKFKVGETRAYKVSTIVTEEQKSTGLNVFLPRDQGMEYAFTTKVNKVLPGDIAMIRYTRPKTMFIMGEFGDSPERREVQKGGELIVDLEISPVNDILEFIDVEKPKPGKGKPAKPNAKYLRSMGMSRQGYTDAIGGQFLTSMYQIALGIGSLSFFDISPVLPVFAVKPGDTWQKTIGYSPKSLYGSKRLAVQRMDMLYTYVGIVTEGKKSYVKISATTKLSTDLGEYLNQSYGVTSKETGIKSLKANFETLYTYLLDATTLAPIRVESKTSGDTVLTVVGPKEPLEETKFTGEGLMVLVSSK